MKVSGAYLIVYCFITGETLLYMLVQPQVVGSLKCDLARHINPDGLIVKNPYNYYLQKEWEGMSLVYLMKIYLTF